MENLCLMRRLRTLAWINMVVLLYGFLHGKVIMGEPQFPAMFVFGDSLVDNGNNNYLNAYAKANYFPYGIDFFQGPTGRFTNGKTCIDYLAEFIGIPYIPPYANPFASGRDILYGVNYASAGGGILEESGQGLGERFSFSKQVENFGITKRQLEDQMSEQELQEYLAKSLAILILGSNDYINNYLLPSYPFRSKFKPHKYADLLINRYTNHTLALYSMGLRRFFLAGIGAIGCSPSQRTAAQAPAGQCVAYSNDMAQLFNTRLRSLVDQLNQTHSDATFIFGDTFAATLDLVLNPSYYGLSVADRACCGIGKNRAEVMCFPLQMPCVNRDQYVFWDSFHPSQAAHKILAMKAYNGPDTNVYPFNLKKLSQV